MAQPSFAQMMSGYGPPQPPPLPPQHLAPPPPPHLQPPPDPLPQAQQPPSEIIKEETMTSASSATSAVPQGPSLPYMEQDVRDATQDVIDDEKLYCKMTDDWFCIQRNSFDCYVNGEPHQAVVFMFSLQTGQFIVRVWSNTISTGLASNLDGIKDKIQETFQGRVPCTGILNDAHAFTDKFLICEFPFSRIISSKCQFLPKQDAQDQQFLCQPCLTLEEEDGPLPSQLYPQSQMEVYNEFPSGDESENNFDGGGVMKEESFSEASSESSGSYSSSNTDNEGIDYTDEDSGDSDNSDKPLKRTRAKKNPGRKKVIKEAMTCPLCKEQFKSVQACQRHKKIVHLFGVYNCELCNTEFPLADEYVIHTQTHHPETAELPCTSCGESFELDWYGNHLKECAKKRTLDLKQDPDSMEKRRGAPKKYKQKKRPEKHSVWHCQYCLLTFPTFHARCAHVKIHAKKPECYICFQMCAALDTLRIHLARVHGLSTVHCQLCHGLKISTMAMFLEHFSTHHPQENTAECFICNQKPNLEDYPDHMQNCIKEKRKLYSKAIVYKCHHCELIFQTDRARKAHEVQEHNEGTKFTCEVCGYATLFKVDLKLHKERHHEDNRRRECCPFCGKSFLEGSLKNHIAYMHEGKKDNSQCKYCGEMFDRSISLRNHMNTAHADMADFQCKICGKKFGLEGGLKTHMMTTHQPPQFACETCGKMFKRKQTLKHHMRIHTGEKPFRCDRCDMAYTTKTSLYTHNRHVHENVPYNAKRKNQ